MMVHDEPGIFIPKREWPALTISDTDKVRFFDHWRCRVEGEDKYTMIADRLIYEGLASGHRELLAATLREYL